MKPDTGVDSTEQKQRRDRDVVSSNRNFSSSTIKSRRVQDKLASQTSILAHFGMHVRYDAVLTHLGVGPGTAYLALSLFITTIGVVQVSSYRRRDNDSARPLMASRMIGSLDDRSRSQMFDRYCAFMS